MPQEAEAHTVTASTQHTADPYHGGVSPEITADPEHADPATPLQNPQKTIF